MALKGCGFCQCSSAHGTNCRNYREFKRSFDRMSLLKIKWSRLMNRLNGHNGLRQTETTTEMKNTPENGETFRVKNCRDPWEFLFVDVHGNIRPCCTSIGLWVICMKKIL